MKKQTAYDLVANALGCGPETLSNSSGLNKHPNWDSFGHLQVMLALEKELGIEIDDHNIKKFSNFLAVTEEYCRKSEVK